MRNPGVEGQPLSPGQLAALRLAASGYTSRQIATRLGTSDRAVHLRLKKRVFGLAPVPAPTPPPSPSVATSSASTNSTSTNPPEEPHDRLVRPHRRRPGRTRPGSD